jgi:hypothetical protein
MKAFKTISYILYPPNYVPGDGYVKCRQLSDVDRLSKKQRFGNGSRVHKLTYVKHNDGRGVWQSKHAYDISYATMQRQP